VSELTDWGRPYFEASGSSADIFYVAYGKPPSSWDISGSKYSVSGIPDGIEIHTYGPTTHPETVEEFKKGYLWESLLERKPDLASKVAEQTECLIIRGSLNDPVTLNYFRNLVGLIQWLFDRGIQGVFDPHAFLWWSAEEWNDVFEKSDTALHSHVMIFTSPENGEEWAHTRGLRKFGRPDLSVRGYPVERATDVGNLINRFIGMQALGAVIPEGQEIKMKGFPSEMYCKHKGHLDDPDFNNVHIEIIWSNSKSSG